MRPAPRPISATLLSGRDLYREVILERLAGARASVLISTANVKEMFIEQGGAYRSILELFQSLSKRGVLLRLLHADVPSRPFRAAFDKKRALVAGGLELKICPRVHFKTVIVDGSWIYLGSANLTGAGLGAKGEDRRNFEMGFVTSDCEVVDQTTALFEAIWSGAECRGCKLRDLCPDPLGPAASPGPTTGPGAKRKRTSGLVTLGKARRIARPSAVGRASR